MALEPRNRHLGLNRRAPRLLRKVNNQPHASSEDHELEDINREPESSSGSEGVDLADIPSSFDRDGKSRRNVGPPQHSRQSRKGRQALVTMSSKVSEDDDMLDQPTSSQTNDKLKKVSTTRKGARKGDESLLHDAFGDSVRPKGQRKVPARQFVRPEVGPPFLDEFGTASTKRKFDTGLGLLASGAHPKKTYGRQGSKVFKEPSTGLPSKSLTTKSFSILPTLTSIDKPLGEEDDLDVHSLVGAETYLDSPKSNHEGSPKSCKKSRSSQESRISPGRKRIRSTHDYGDPPPASSNRRASPHRFKMPETLTQAITRLQDKEFEEDEELEGSDEPITLPDHGPCPMRCGKILPRYLLETLDPRATLRDQQEFCRKHQITDAKAECESEGYPIVVDWDQFRKRLKKYRKAVKNMIEKPGPLYFRSELEQRVKKDRNRTIFQQFRNEDLANVGAGYYGPKGLEATMEYIMTTFSAEIREQAAKDKIISAQSPSGYIEMVLAPELATLLIKDDMKVDDQTARTIMIETQNIGNLLHSTEDKKQIVKRSREIVEELEDFA